MSLIIQDSKMIQKYSTIPGVIPTIPVSGSTDHTDGTWIDTDIYEGEFFSNIPDNKLWYRFSSGIVQLYPLTSTAITSQQVFLYDSVDDFPETGNIDTIYIDKNVNIIYYWDSVAISYVQIATVASVYWNAIIDGPSASTYQIDNAVNLAHGVNDLNINYLTSGETDLRYVLQVTGSGLTQNNFTNYYKNILDNFTGGVVIEDDKASFPLTGSESTLYLERTDKNTWIWRDSLGDYELYDSYLHNLSDLSDVLISGATSGQVLTYNGTKWINEFPEEGNVGGSGTATYLPRWQDETTLEDSVVSNEGKYTGFVRTPNQGTYINIGEEGTDSLDTIIGISNQTTSNAVRDTYGIKQNISSSITGTSLYGVNSELYIGNENNCIGSTTLISVSGDDKANNIYGSQINIAGDASTMIGETIEVTNSSEDAVGSTINVASIDGNAYGIKIDVTSTNANAYPLQITDGQQAYGKVLTCLDSDGNAKWEALPANPAVFSTSKFENQTANVTVQSTIAANKTIEIDYRVVRIDIDGSMSGKLLINFSGDGNSVNATEYGTQSMGTISGMEIVVNDPVVAFGTSITFTITAGTWNIYYAQRIITY